jgi:hypothetical protein
MEKKRRARAHSPAPDFWYLITQHSSISADIGNRTGDGELAWRVTDPSDLDTRNKENRNGFFSKPD